MEPDERALLAAIRAHPHDDTPRLVYADWLDEHERPERAEFIRVQIALARFGDVTAENRERWHELHEHERELLALDTKLGWNGFLLDCTERNVDDRLTHLSEWRRGFLGEFQPDDEGDVTRILQLGERHPIEHLTLRPELWVQHADAILRDHPEPTVVLLDVPLMSSDGERVGVAFRERTYALSELRFPDARPGAIVQAVFAAEWPRVRFDWSVAGLR